jgi:hypothetical protein
MTLSEIRTLYAAMLEADAAYKKADPSVVHIAYYTMRNARFEFNQAAGEYVAALIEESKPVAPIQIDRSNAE